MNMNRAINLKKVHVLSMAILALTATGAYAFDFSGDNSDWSGRFDTTISYGASWRAGDLDPDNVSKAYHDPFDIFLSNAERRESVGRWSVNNDNGNRNYPDGGDLVSHTIKFTSELDVTYKNFGLRIFCRKKQKSVSAMMSGYWICTYGPNTRLATAS